MGRGKPTYMHTTEHFSMFDLNVAVEFKLTYRSNSFGKMRPEKTAKFLVYANHI